MVSTLDLPVEVLVHSAEEWLARELPPWATATRFNVRQIGHRDAIVLTAVSTYGDVGHAVFDRLMSHLQYIETRKDCRSRGVATRLWGQVRKEAVRPDITASVDSEEGQRRLRAWGFVEEDGIWTWRNVRN